jgi:hypothetical protein
MGRGESKDNTIDLDDVVRSGPDTLPSGPSQALLQEALDYDGLYEAEKITGKSYKDDQETLLLGLKMNQEATERRRRLMRANDDTSFDSSLKDILRIAKSEGFREVMRDTYLHGRDKLPDELIVLFKDDEGILLVIDTWKIEGEEDKANGVNIYFNFDCGESGWGPEHSSGRILRNNPELNPRIYVGNTDVREGLKVRLNEGRSHGKYINPWFGPQTIYKFATKGEAGSNKRRYEALPQEVRDCLGLSEEDLRDLPNY